MLSGKNNTQSILAGIVNGGYTYVFTSFEIVLFKKFKNNISDQSFFINYLCLLAIDKIHFVGKWGKNFRPQMYVKIEKVQKQIPCHIFLLRVLATLAKNILLKVMKKVGFLPNYRLM